MHDPGPPSPPATRLIGFAGWSGSGKTTLLARLIPVLVARGLRVSSIKHAHHDFDVDQPGKDSHTHRMAGATEVLVTSARRWALMHELRDDPEPSLDMLLDRLSPVDLVLVEGFKRDAYAKIEVHRPTVGKPLLQPGDPDIIAVASDAALDLPVPVLPLDGIEAIADFVMAQARPIGGRARRVTEYVFVLVVGLVSGALSGIVGTGSSIMLLPLLVFQFGPKQAVPIMAISGLMANVAKAAAWWREVDWRAFAAYTCTGVPAAALGARTLLVLPSHWVDGALGVFFLAMIPARRWLHARSIHIGLWQLAVAGGVIGFLTGIVLSTGPLSVPAFTAFGLVKGAFLATEAISSLALFASKAATFRELGALPLAAIVQGLVVGSSVMLGSFAGKIVVQRMSTGLFQHVLDALLLCSGLSMLWAAVA